MEAHARVFTGPIYCVLCPCFNLEFIGGLHKYQPVIANGTSVPAEEVGIEVHGSRHLGCSNQRQLSLTIYDVQVTRENGLPFLHNIHISRALLFGGKNSKLNSI